MTHIIYYYDRFKRKIEYTAYTKKDYERIKIELFERSVTEDIGAIYTVDENGEEKELCYYND